MVLAAAAALSFLIWIYLFLWRGNYWRVDRSVIKQGVSSDVYVTAVIPARDEAEHIGEAVCSLLQQDIPVRVIVVDDASADGTAEAARAAVARLGVQDRFEVISGKPLPPGWSGKLWAVSQGVEQALVGKPDYLLLTDADIVHGTGSVRDLIGQARRDGNDLTSLMVHLMCRSTAEKLLIPAFVFFFLQLYPPAWIENPKANTAAAAGGCMLIRPPALERIGGIAAIRKEVIDDCALARAVKKRGGRVWMGLTTETHSIRPYQSFSQIGNMISRSAFNQLRHSTLLLLLTVAGLLLTYVIPLAAVLFGSVKAVLLGLAAYVLMTLCYLPMIRFYGLRWLWAFTLPVIALFYLGATIHSAVRYWFGRGGIWKGRVQDTTG